MFLHMATVRTTLVLDEQAFAQLRQIAAEEGRTLSSVVDETLRIGIERRQSGQQTDVPNFLPAFSMGAPRVNIADRDKLYDAIGT
jgi:hypothetical protein